VIKIWAILAVRGKDVRKLVNSWTHSDSVNREACTATRVDLEEVNRFWTGKNGIERNLLWVDSE
jgi:hypothetical protein